MHQKLLQLIYLHLRLEHNPSECRYQQQPAILDRQHDQHRFQDHEVPRRFKRLNTKLGIWIDD